MQKSTTPLLLKGFLGVVLLWQTACTNTTRMGMEGESSAPTDLEKALDDPLALVDILCRLLSMWGTTKVVVFLKGTL